MSIAELFALPNEEWMTESLCSQTDPEVFFPEKGGANRTAKAICAACPVFDLCRDYALTHDEYGVWAGMSEHDRRGSKARAALAKEAS